MTQPRYVDVLKEGEATGKIVPLFPTQKAEDYFSLGVKHIFRNSTCKCAGEFSEADMRWWL